MTLIEMWKAPYLARRIPLGQLGQSTPELHHISLIFHLSLNSELKLLALGFIHPRQRGLMVSFAALHPVLASLQFHPSALRAVH
jgi:hypothetical protein